MFQQPSRHRSQEVEVWKRTSTRSCLRHSDLSMFATVEEDCEEMLDAFKSIIEPRLEWLVPLVALGWAVSLS